MGRPVVHFEVGCRDSEKTQVFCSKIFDWKIEVMGLAAMIAAEAHEITGHITVLGREPHQYTIFYVDIEDVAAALEKSQGARREDPGAPGGDSDGDVCVVAGPGEEYGGVVEGEKIRSQQENWMMNSGAIC
jgi:hypothetical protein